MKKMNKEHKVLLVLIVLLSIGIGYAFLNTQLKINGTADISDGRWNVHFENYQETANSTVSPTSGNAPVITGDTTTEISYAVNFNEPGDVYEFTVFLVNGGTLNADVISLDTTVKVGDVEVSDIPTYIDYSITYANGDDYILPHALSTGNSEQIRVRVGYKQDITTAQYEESKLKTLHFNLKAVCTQGDNMNITYVYTDVKSIPFHIGQRIPIGVKVSTSLSDVYNDIFLRHKMVNGKIERTDIGLYATGTYFILPCGDGLQKTIEYLNTLIVDDHNFCYQDNGIFYCDVFWIDVQHGIDVSTYGWHCVVNGESSYCENVD